MRLWQHPNGVYYVLYGPAERKRISARTRDRRQAEAFYREFAAGLENPAVPNPTIAQILKDYEIEHGPEIRSPESLKFAVRALTDHLGTLKPEELTPIQAKAYAKARGAAPGTILRDIGVLRAALKWALDHKRLSSMPAIPNPVRAPRPRQRWLSREEGKSLLRAAHEPHIRVFLALAMMTAARLGAILEAKWTQVDWGRRLIDYGDGHGNKRRAIVPINEDLFAILEGAHALACSDYIVEFRGDRVESVRNGFRAACRRAGLIGVTPHTLRHSAASWMVESGVPLAQIARFLGDEEAMVERVYGKFSPAYLQRAAEALRL